jgi:phage protein D
VPLTLTIDSTPVPLGIDDQQVDFEFREGLGALDSLTLSIEPWDAAVELKKKIGLGKPYVIEIGEKKVKFEGFVVSLEYQDEGRGRTLHVQGLDALFKMRQNTHARVWQAMATDKVVKEIANEYGLTPKVAALAVTPLFEMQSGETDLDFLLALARRYHCSVRTVGKELRFQPLHVAAAGKALEVTLGDDLTSFRMAYSLANQATQVTVSGWDDIKDKQIKAVSKGAKLKKISKGETGPATYKKALGAAEIVIDNVPLTTEVEAKAHADAVHQRLAFGFASGTLVMRGNDEALSGKTVKVSGAGDLNGEYLATETVHRIDRHGGYTTTVRVVSDSLVKPAGK